MAGRLGSGPALGKHKSRRLRAVAAGLTLAAAPAWAGPMQALGPDGARWKLNDDTDPTRLERRAMSGGFDPSFGRDGRVDIDGAGEDANFSALRVDQLGRAWVGATVTGSGTASPWIQRRQPDGQVDTRWAVGGRSTTSPVGQRVNLVDLLPQADGSLWVSGNLYGTQGDSTAALWRLKPDGSLDYNFGVGGVWRRPGADRSRAMSLAAGPAGSVAIGVELLSGRTGEREVYIVPAGAREPRGAPVGTTGQEDSDDEAFVLFDGRGWQWQPGPQTAGVAGAAVEVAQAPAWPPSAPNDVGHIALNPFAGQDTAASAPTAPAPVADDTPWAWWAAGIAALVGLAAVWRWRASRA